MNQETLNQYLTKKEGIHIRNPDEKSKLLETVNALLRSVEELRWQIEGPPTVYELIRAKIDAEIDSAWEKYPRIAYEVDFALCGSDWAISELPLKELPKIVEEAVAKFGEELEQEIESSLIRDEAGEIQSQGDLIDKHEEFRIWLKNYHNGQ